MEGPSLHGTRTSIRRPHARYGCPHMGASVLGTSTSARRACGLRRARVADVLVAKIAFGAALPWLVVVHLGATACGDSKLDTETARRLIAERPLFHEGVICQWRRGDGANPRLGPLDYEPIIEGRCVDALTAAGLAEKHECLHPLGDGICLRAEWLPRPPAEFARDEGRGTNSRRVNFPCGRARIVSIDSIVTEDRHATVRYTVSYQWRTELTSACDSVLPEQRLRIMYGGPAIRTTQERFERRAMRDDTSKWLLDSASPRRL